RSGSVCHCTGIWVYDIVCHIDIFFFQAEDGIRDFHVTGVQTCALPIYREGLDGRDAGAGGGALGGEHAAGGGELSGGEAAGAREIGRASCRECEVVPGGAVNKK